MARKYRDKSLHGKFLTKKSGFFEFRGGSLKLRVESCVLNPPPLRGTPLEGGEKKCGSL